MHTPSTRILSALAYDRGQEYPEKERAALLRRCTGPRRPWLLQDVDRRSGNAAAQL
jgi:hypothetical protein